MVRRRRAALQLQMVLALTLALTLTLPWFIFPHWGPKGPARQHKHGHETDFYKAKKQLDDVIQSA